MKKALILLIVVTVLFAILADTESKDSIVICSSMEQFRSDEMQAQLNDRFPDKNIIVMYMATGKAAAKIYAEGPNTEVDILAGMETGYLNKIKDSLADITGTSRIPYMDGVTVEDNGGQWVTWERQAGAIVINREILEKYNLPAPQSIYDLLKPEYKGLVAMPDPKSSGTGYFFYKSWVNSMGQEEALAFVDQLYGNLKQFTESGSGPIKLLKQGEIAVGLALTFQAVNERNDGQPFDIVFPEQGSPYSLTGTAVIQGHQDKEGVMEVFDFLANEFLKYDKEYFSPEQIYADQVNRIENYPQNVTFADMTGIQDDKEKERLLNLWKY